MSWVTVRSIKMTKTHWQKGPLMELRVLGNLDPRWPALCSSPSAGPDQLALCSPPTTRSPAVTHEQGDRLVRLDHPDTNHAAMEIAGKRKPALHTAKDRPADV